MLPVALTLNTLALSTKSGCSLSCTATRAWGRGANNTCLASCVYRVQKPEILVPHCLVLRMNFNKASSKMMEANPYKTTWDPTEIETKT